MATAPTGRCAAGGTCQWSPSRPDQQRIPSHARRHGGRGGGGARRATGRVPLGCVARRAKTITVAIDGEQDDLGFIDVVLLRGDFIGAPAIWDPSLIQRIVVARAEPAAIGVSAIGGLLCPLDDASGGGVVVDVGEGGPLTVRAPIAPGLYEPVPIRDWRRLKKGKRVRLEGPGIIALDGERERRLMPGQTASVSIRRDGPWVIDVQASLVAAARSGLFQTAPTGRKRGH